MKTTLALALLLAVFNAHANSYIVLGQSNAKGIVKFGNLSASLANNGVPAKIYDCTHPGQPIYNFRPSYNIYSNYAQCLKSVGDDKISGIVFWQGESNTWKNQDSRDWHLKAENLFRALRQDLAQGNVPIIMVLLNNRAQKNYFPYWERIRQMQTHMYAPKLATIDSSGYEFVARVDRPDGTVFTSPVHLTEAGYLAISNDIAAKLLATQSNNP